MTEKENYDYQTLITRIKNKNRRYKLLKEEYNMLLEEFNKIKRI